MALWLHIGMAKAGSTAIQRFLGKNLKALAEHGFHFPQVLHKGPWHRRLFEYYDNEIGSEFKSECKNDSDVILSYESAVLAPLSTIKELTRDADETKVICYVRDPVYWLNSYYVHLYRAPWASYTQISEFSIDHHEGYARMIDIGRYLERWESVVGRSSISVAPYDPTTNVIGSFLDWIGIPDAAPEQFIALRRNPNRSADISGLRVMLEMKRRIGDKDTDRLFKVMMLAHKRLGDRWIDTRVSPPLMFLTEEERAKIRARYGPSYEEVFSRYGAESRPKTPDDKEVLEVDRGALAALTPEEMKFASKLLRTAKVKSFFKACEGIFRRKNNIVYQAHSSQR